MPSLDKPIHDAAETFPRVGACLQAIPPRARPSSPASRLLRRVLRLRCVLPRTAATFLQLACSLSAFPLATSAADLELRLTDAKTNQPVADAVISLTALDPPAASSTPLSATSSPPALSPAAGATATLSAASTPAEIMQRDEEFSPFVTAVRTGTAVRFPNRDTVQHHVYSLSKPKKFELPLYDPGKAETVVFDQPGIVTVGCNIHDWMLAYVVIVDTPHFAVSPATGSVTLRDLPPGRYRADLWHPRLAKPITRELTVAAAADATAPLSFSLALKPDRRIHRVPDTSAGSYK